MAAVLALGSAFALGTADFLGGLAARRARVLSIALLAQTAGGVLVLLAAPLAGASPTRSALLIGGVSGLAGALGTVAYFRALAIGPMGVAAQLAALVGTLVPVTVGLAAGERPTAFAGAGAVVGLVATWLVSSSGGRGGPESVARPSFGWALLGGAGFGLFLVGLDQAPLDSGLWPLVGARAVSIPILLLLVAASSDAARREAWPWRLGLSSGVLDMAANVLFLFATRAGQLSITSMLASLYPVVVILLAGFVLRERVSGTQGLGISAAVVAVTLLSA